MPGQHNTQEHSRVGLALVLIGTVALSLLLFGFVIHSAQAQTLNDDRRVDATRTAEQTVVDPGDEVDVEISFSLDEQTHLDIAEGIQPPVADVSGFTLTHATEGEQSEDFRVWDENGGVVLFDDLPAGEYTASYSIQVHDDVPYGTEYSFRGGVQKAVNSTPNRVEQYQSVGTQSDLSTDTFASLDNTDELSGDSAITVGGETNITADQPDNQTVEVNVSFAADTEATANLTKDDATVVSETVSGTAGTNQTATLDMTGLSDGTYGLTVDSPDSANVTVEDTVLVTEQIAALNATDNETVAVDVEFDADQVTNATVTFEQGTDTNVSTIQFDPVAADDGTGIETVTYETNRTGDVNVTVETSPASGYAATWVSGESDSAFGGAFAGATTNHILGFLLLVVGLAAAYQRDLI